jgi:hypothetical protein
MKIEIKKFEQLPEELLVKQEEKGVSIQIGDIFFTAYNDSSVIRISEIVKRSKKDEWQVNYQQATKWDASEWSSYNYGADGFDSFLSKVSSGEYTKINPPFSKIMEEANKVISGEIPISGYEEKEIGDLMNNEYALIGRGTKDGLISLQKNLEEKKNTAALIHKAVMFEMAKRKAELDKIRSDLYGVIKKFEKQIKKIVRVITTIELYLGIDEEIHQIQSGELAPKETPISFRQLVLFIDEEVGVHEDGGFDFRNIEDFDNWLVTDNNIDIVLPEKKGMVVLRPRRYDKDYGDKYLNISMNVPNQLNTYILIRNGENVYRIFTEKLIIKDRLFPRRKELNELYDKMQETNWETGKEKIEDEMYQYKKRAILMQGLIDRTEIFYPLPVEKLNIFKLHEAQEFVNFIYDDEMQLTDGRLPFNDWWTNVNTKISHGSRILLTGEYGRYYSRTNDYADRFFLASASYDGLKNVPDLPKRGVYEVEEFTSSYSRDFRGDEYEQEKKELIEKGTKFKDEGIVNGKTWRMADKNGDKKIYRLRIFNDKPKLTIKYLPDAEASEGWNRWDTHSRKNKTRFTIHKDDDFVINYDQIELADIEYYLHNRVDRKNYLKMMPVLKELKKELIKEQEKESYFIRFVADRNRSIPDVENKIKRAIVWWKFKNKWKRSITKNDTLATRMIEKKIKTL